MAQNVKWHTVTEYLKKDSFQKPVYVFVKSEGHPVDEKFEDEVLNNQTLAPSINEQIYAVLFNDNEYWSLLESIKNKRYDQLEDLLLRAGALEFTDDPDAFPVHLFLNEKLEKKIGTTGVKTVEEMKSMLNYMANYSNEISFYEFKKLQKYETTLLEILAQSKTNFKEIKTERDKPAPEQGFYYSSLKLPGSYECLIWDYESGEDSIAFNYLASFLVYNFEYAKERFYSVKEDLQRVDIAAAIGSDSLYLSEIESSETLIPLRCMYTPIQPSEDYKDLTMELAIEKYGYSYKLWLNISVKREK